MKYNYLIYLFMKIEFNSIINVYFMFVNIVNVGMQYFFLKVEIDLFENYC